MNTYDTVYAMRYKLGYKLVAVMGILHCQEQLGNNKNAHVYEYLKNYPDLSKLPYHELKYISELLRDDKNIEIHQLILDGLIDLSKYLPRDNEIITQLHEYKKYPWKASIQDLAKISEILVEMSDSGSLIRRN